MARVTKLPQASTAPYLLAFLNSSSIDYSLDRVRNKISPQREMLRFDKRHGTSSNLTTLIQIKVLLPLALRKLEKPASLKLETNPWES